MANKIPLSPQIDRFRRQLQKNPNSRVFAPLADAYRKEGMIDEAIKICEEGLKKHPDYSSAHVVLGRCYYDNGNFAKAKNEFEITIKLDSQNQIALEVLAEIYEQEGNIEKAIQNYEQILNLDPFNDEAQDKLNQLQAILSSPSGNSEVEAEGGVGISTDFDISLSNGDTLDEEEEIEEIADLGDFSLNDDLESNSEDFSIDISESNLEIPDSNTDAEEISLDDEFGDLDLSEVDEDLGELILDDEGFTLDKTDTESSLEDFTLSEGLKSAEDFEKNEVINTSVSEEQNMEFDDLSTEAPVVEISLDEELPDDATLGIEETLILDDLTIEPEGDLSLSKEYETNQEINLDEEDNLAEENLGGGLLDLDALAEESVEIEEFTLDDDMEEIEESNEIEKFTLDDDMEKIEESTLPLVNYTIAEQYEAQGYIEQALQVYKQLLNENPNDITIKNKIVQLQTQLISSQPISSPTTAAGISLDNKQLETLLYDIIHKELDEKSKKLHKEIQNLSKEMQNLPTPTVQYQGITLEELRTEVNKLLEEHIENMISKISHKIMQQLQSDIYLERLKSLIDNALTEKLKDIKTLDISNQEDNFAISEAEDTNANIVSSKDLDLDNLLGDLDTTISPQKEETTDDDFQDWLQNISKSDE